MILIEFNELCPPLLHRWMEDGTLPNFKSFYDASDVFTTEADETKAPNLEPWIQWYSLHTGLPYRTHQVFHLTDGPRAGHRDIWSALLDHGKSVWNCSSMNAGRVSGPRAFYLPDPWCDQQKSNPAELDVFSRFVSRQVKESSNKDRSQNVREAMDFVRFMLGRGLSANSILSTCRQLLSEVATSGRESWRRATLLDKFLFDVFKFYFNKMRPDFSSFFVNSTAHLQHSYWRHMSPEGFLVAPAKEELERFGGAILFGYKQMDELLGRFMRLAGKDVTLVFVTALSQQPFLKFEHVGGQHFYRPRSVGAMLNTLGVHPSQTEPVMTHQFLLRFESADAAQKAQRVLAAVQANGEQVFGFSPGADNSIYFGCQIKSALDKSVMLNFSNELPNARFFDLFYQIEGLKSGCHHPDGCLWIRRGQHVEHEQKVSILDVFPTILDFYGIPASDCVGRSLISADQSVESYQLQSAVNH